MKQLIILFILITSISLSQVRPPDEKLTAYLTANAVELALNKASGAVQGSGTSNLIAYWTGTSSIGSLSTATYPSLTELARLKGITSPIMTLLSTKQATLVSGTNIKTINGISLLGSGNIVITSDTTGMYAKIYASVLSIISSQSESIIGSKATLDSMIVDFRKNNYLRLNK